MEGRTGNHMNRTAKRITIQLGFCAVTRPLDRAPLSPCGDVPGRANGSMPMNRQVPTPVCSIGEMLLLRTPDAGMSTDCKHVASPGRSEARYRVRHHVTGCTGEVAGHRRADRGDPRYGVSQLGRGNGHRVVGCGSGIGGVRGRELQEGVLLLGDRSREGPVRRRVACGAVRRGVWKKAKRKRR